MQHHMPYGYQMTVGTITVVEEHAQMINWIFRSYISGLSLRKIAMMLNEKSIPDGKKNTLWTHVKVGNILQNPKYAGDEYFPMIVTREIFEQAQIIRKQTEEKRRQGIRAGNSRYFYSGKLICGECGAVYYANAIRGKHFWECRSHVKNNYVACRNQRVYDAKLDAAGKKLLKELLYRPELYKRILAGRVQMESQETLELSDRICSGKENHEALDVLLQLYLKRTEARYALLKVDDIEYLTGRIKQDLGEYRKKEMREEEILETIVSSVEVHMDGTLIYKLVNGNQVSIECEEGGCVCQDRHAPQM